MIILAVASAVATGAIYWIAMEKSRSRNPLAAAFGYAGLITAGLVATGGFVWVALS